VENKDKKSGEILRCSPDLRIFFALVQQSPVPHVYYRNHTDAIDMIRIRHNPLIVTLLLSVLTAVATDAGPPAGAMEPTWVEQSNRYAAILLEANARFLPERASSLGLSAYDTAIIDLKPGHRERAVQALSEASERLKEVLRDESEGPVRQDLLIMIGEAESRLEGMRLEDQYLVPYTNVSSLIYYGLSGLLEDRIPDERKKNAAVRLQKYVGAAEGTVPLTELARKEVLEGFQAGGRLAPFREEVERGLATSETYLLEIRNLFDKYAIGDPANNLDLLEEQVRAYNRFVKEEILPVCRESFLLPVEVYAHNLQEYGVDMPLNELVQRASVGFEELQDQMQMLAAYIAEDRGMPSRDYRDVIREFKKEILDSASILPFYREQIREIEEIILREEIVTLPERDMTIRLATPAESAASPSPRMSPPRLIGNTGEHGEFVLPLQVSGGSEGSSLQVDDFMYKAASWALTAHEGRPGHELQYTSIVERGVSQARVIFAMNSVNVEGWALYMEEQMLPYVPMEGQFIILWSRLVRAARAFLDPGLNTGTLTVEEARRILREDLVLSEALVRSELERYRFRAPGQATSYYNGYLRMMELRAETERKLGADFSKKDFHDFILSQGLLPPRLLREAVMTGFIPQYLPESRP